MAQLPRRPVVGGKGNYANHRTSIAALEGWPICCCPLHSSRTASCFSRMGHYSLDGHFAVPDMHSATHSEMHALTARLNSVLRLGSGWMLNADLIRSRAPGYPEQGSFPHAVTRVIDDERRQQFMDEGAHFESDYFLTLTYLPPIETEEKVKGVDVRRPERRVGSGVVHQILERFKSRVEMFENVFSALFRTERG